jgi:hypothetical protein
MQGRRSPRVVSNSDEKPGRNCARALIAPEGFRQNVPVAAQSPVTSRVDVTTARRLDLLSMAPDSRPPISLQSNARGVHAMKDKPRRRWSRRVTKQSNALDLEAGVFALEQPRAIAESLKRSADASRRRKSDPFRSAMSMLNFYINRAGRNLPRQRRARLEAAKEELRRIFDRPR